MFVSAAHEDAPKRAHMDDAEQEIIGKSITINRARSELSAYWLALTNLPSLMHAIKRIEVTGDRSGWTAQAPAGQHVTLESELVAVVENQSIGGRSIEGCPIKTAGIVTFADAPSDRGSVVTAEIAYEHPDDNAGRVFAKLFRAGPHIQARHELKRRWRKPHPATRPSATTRTSGPRSY